MKSYRADLHIHSLLSPCGSLDMSPARIIREAKERKIDIIAVADHNSTRQAGLIKKLGQETGITVLTGAEVNTREEVHCLCLFGDEEATRIFQEFLDARLPEEENDVVIFGDQVVVDKDEQIVYTEDRLLISALRAGIKEIETLVHKLNGIFIPAHIDRPYSGILDRLGFIPENLEYDALELSYRMPETEICGQHPELCGKYFLRSSDAHYPKDIGRATTTFELEENSFEAVRAYLRSKLNQ
ncbi:PHP domain-containing protein [Prolixibacter sp. NT017]|uniref:PHP domain-containing protein n=1 Tax=Prolixibacter sp. NT017 TaxID=2652390 RepID=UPI0012847A46|nr:PHP domain-containing protein [Prolixibacter sp. NT017]GET26465.1 histidinol-phosphatase [Prolixibacter sp. NT017]